MCPDRTGFLMRPLCVHHDEAGCKRCCDPTDGCYNHHNGFSWSVHGVRRGGCTGSWWGNRREGDHWGDLGIDGWIILGWISRRWDVGMWTGLGWPRIETVGGGL